MSDSGFKWPEVWGPPDMTAPTWGCPAFYLHKEEDGRMYWYANIDQLTVMSMGPGQNIFFEIRIHAEDVEPEVLPLTIEVVPPGRYDRLDEERPLPKVFLAAGVFDL